MKRVLVVAALLGAMLLVDWLALPQAPAAASLAGMGFVMLAAYAVAEIGTALSLPQVTGYILAGLALGPSVGGIISGELIGDMRMFNTLALGLIATSAGLELDVRQIARLMRTLLWTTLIKVVVGVSLVALALVAMESLLGLLALESRAELLTLALVLGVLSIGTSPSISLAVLTETRAKGRLSELVLGAAVFKDLVVVVGLALATALGRAWLSPEEAAGSSVLAHVALELGGSIVAGALVGGVFIAYVRFIRAEMLLFIAAMILVVAELCRAFHLELLLVFIAAGFVVRNASSYEHELMRPLRLVALPVFVLFFANAGASVDLVTTYEILPIALAICVVRAAVYLLASHVGGRWGGEPRAIRQHAWLAYLPQAGVTLGLVGVASLQLPELAGPITNTGMAVVALNLLVGPVTLRRALAALREIPPPEPEPASTAASPPITKAAPLPHAESSPRPPAPLVEPLQRHVEELEQALHRVFERFEAELRPTLPPLPELGDTTPELGEFRAVVIVYRERYRELYTEVMAPLTSLPRVIYLERAPGRRRATMPRFLRGRRVPFRHVARIALGPALAQLVARRFEADLRSGAPVSRGASARDGSAHDAGWPEIELGLSRLSELLTEVSSGKRRARSLRYSLVEPEVRRSLGGLMLASDVELARLARAAWGSALLSAKGISVSDASADAVLRTLIEPARATAERIPPTVEALAGWLEQRVARETRASRIDVERLREEFEARVRHELGDIAREFRFAATVRATLTELVNRARGAVESIDSLWLEEGAPLTQGKVQSVPFRAHVEGLNRHIMPPIELAARSIASSLNQLPRRIEDAAQQEWAALAVNDTGVPSRDRIPRSGLTRAAKRLSLLDAAAATVRAIDMAIAGLDISLESAHAAFRDGLLPGPARDGQREAPWKRWLRRFERLQRGVLTRLQGERGGLVGAEAIRGSLRELDRARLPATVERWFELAPVNDERIFAAHHRLLNEVLDADSARADLGRASLLVVGTSGSGKSSLLNLCELELPYSAHLRLHAAEFPRDVTLFEAMGTLLDCEPTAITLSEQLDERGPAILLDDLPSWLSAATDRGSELQRVLDLIAQTSQRAFWVVSMETTMRYVLGELVAFDEVFTHSLQLPPFSPDEVRRMIESRIEQLEDKVEFPSGRRASVSGARGVTPAASRFYRKLWRASRGHPGRALILCRNAFALEGHALTLRPDAVKPPGDLAIDLTSSQLAVLATLRRFGAQPVGRLADELTLSLPELQRSVGFLMTAGLVASTDTEHTVAISPAADWAVQALLLRARLALEA